ncbi:MAG: DUF2889 domain-containing protein [Gammaproteobacteria bacterium]|nr:MAG: DUF2889 domain-containing protein [Gammaproteobacteria bacterium]
MPLPPPAERQPLHSRTIHCEGYRRADGLWDIEAHLLDVRDEPMETFGRGEIAPGEPLHEMWMRMTVDDELQVRDLQASIEHAPYPSCPHFPRAPLQKLIGQRIAPGWTARVRLVMGGIKGCTHLVELLGPLATTAIQTVYAWRGEALDDAHNQPPADFIDSCHSLARHGAVARQLWPNLHSDEDR